MKKKILQYFCYTIIVIVILAIFIGMLYVTITFSMNKSAEKKPSWTEVETKLERVFLTKDIIVLEEYDDTYSVIYKIEANGFTYLVEFQLKPINVTGFFYSWQYVNHTMVLD